MLHREYFLFRAAPVNAAFEALPEGMLDMLLLPENIGILQDVLKYHILSGAITSAGMVSGDYTARQGGNVTLEVSDGGVKVNYAAVLYPDISASNGIVHVIDAVLLPPVETGLPNDPPPTATTEVPPGDGASDATPAVTSGSTVAVVGDDPGPVERLVSAQFLEMDTSPDMNIINQNDEYIYIPDDPSDVSDVTLSYTSVSANLDPAVPLEDQLDLLPGGVILILVGRTAIGEIVRNRLMWTYTMGCGEEDLTVRVGEGLGWTMFVSFVLCFLIINDCCPEALFSNRWLYKFLIASYE